MQNNESKPKSTKECFDRIALREGFDPLVPENWYQLSRDSFSLDGVMNDN